MKIENKINQRLLEYTEFAIIYYDCFLYTVQAKYDIDHLRKKNTSNVKLM